MRDSEQSPNGEKVIASFDKSPTRQVRLSVKEYQGEQLVHLRVWGKWGDSDDYRPTKDGLTVSVDLFPKLKQSVLAAEKALAELE